MMIVKLCRQVLGVLAIILLSLLVPSHSPLLFDGNHRRCVFDPSAQEGEEQKERNRKLKAGATVK